MELTERAAYLKGLIEGLGIDETTKEGKIIKAMNELLGELSTAVMGLDEDLTQAYDLINDLNDEIEDLEADLYEEERSRTARTMTRKRAMTTSLFTRWPAPTADRPSM